MYLIKKRTIKSQFYFKISKRNTSFKIQSKKNRRFAEDDHEQYDPNMLSVSGNFH